MGNIFSDQITLLKPVNFPAFGGQNLSGSPDAFLNDHKISFFEKSCYVTWTEVIDPFLVEQILSWTVPISHSRVL